MVCIPCVNWKHRCNTGHLVRSKENPRRRMYNTAKKFSKPLLQIDQSILFLIQPGKMWIWCFVACSRLTGHIRTGKYAVPDERCWQRLLDVLFDPSGLVYQHIMPPNVRSIVSSMMDTDVHGVVRAW